MRRRSLLILLLLPVAVILTGCLTEYVRTPNYYILEYYPHLEKRELIQSTAVPASVHVMDTKIPRTYSRRQIVTRGIGPQIQYESNEIWGVDLKDTIADLIARRTTRYNLFRSVQREYELERAIYQIQSEVRSLEYVISRGRGQANLAMEMRLVETESKEVLVRHSFDRLDPLAESSFETFVIEINTMILQETDEFLRKAVDYLNGRRSTTDADPGPRTAPGAAPAPSTSAPNPAPAQKTATAAAGAAGAAAQAAAAASEAAAPDASVPGPAGAPAAPGTDGTGTALPAGNGEELPEGRGAVMLPALSDGSAEPFYRIMNRNDELTAEARMGETVVLPVGTYSAVVGSGNADQLMRIDGIRVASGYKTIVPASWGALTVHILSEDRESLRIRYEVFDAATGESYGTDISSNEEIGEQPRVWLLEPKMYKVVVNNLPFNSYRNFATIHVHRGDLQRLTVVMETDQDGTVGNLIGAGVIDLLDDNAERGPQQFYSAFNASGSISSDNTTDRDSFSSTVILTGQVENRYLFEQDPIVYSVRNLVEIGTLKGPDTDFRRDADNFDLRNTLIFYFLRDIGAYTRFDLQTHFFPEIYYGTEDSAGGTYRLVDAEGAIEEQGLIEDGVRVKPPFFPLVLKEGIGLNLRAYNTSRASLNLRAGLGFRQTFNSDVYVRTDEVVDGDDVYAPVESLFDVGTELSLVGFFILPFDLTFTTNVDALFPFSPDRTIALEWENLLSLQLFRFVSLDYRFTLSYQELELADPYFAQDHSLFLRLTYVIR